MILRAFLAVLAAIVVNVLLVSLGEVLLGKAFPPPPGVNLADAAQMSAFARSMSPAAFLLLLGSWAAGAIGGAVIGYQILRRTWAAWVGPVANLVGVTFSIATIPHPIWVATIGLLTPFLAGWFVPRLLNPPQQVGSEA